MYERFEMGRYWAHGDPVMTFWFGSRPMRVLGLTKRNQKAGTNCKAEKGRGYTGSYLFEKPGWYWVQGTWLGWSLLDENSDLLLCNRVKHSEWRSRSRSDGRRRCVCCWATDASNLVVKVRREVVDTEILRLYFQRRFQNVVYDTPEPAWICVLRFYCI